jgi:hypothetical protein
MELIIKLNKYDAFSQIRYDKMCKMKMTVNEILLINKMLLENKFQFKDIQKHLQKLKLGNINLCDIDLEDRLIKLQKLGKDTSSEYAFILRYGEILGKELLQQKTTKTTPKDGSNFKLTGNKKTWLKFFGPTIGEQKYNEYLAKRNTTYAIRRHKGNYKHMNSLSVFINKHGKEKGTQLFYEKMKKMWNSQKPGQQTSKIATELFDTLQKHINDVCYYGGTEKIINYKTNYYKVDFCYQNSIIEFFGDRWHGNPRKYNEDAIITRYGGKKQSVKDIHRKDNRRLKNIKKLNYSVLVIWEYDYRHFPETTIQQCFEFLQLHTAITPATK